MPKTVVSARKPVFRPVATIAACGGVAVVVWPRSSVTSGFLMTFQIFFEGESAVAGRVRAFPWLDVVLLVLPEGASGFTGAIALTALQAVWWGRWQVDNGGLKTTGQVQELIKR